MKSATMSNIVSTTSSLPLFPILILLCFFICHKLFPRFIPLPILFNYIIPVSYNHLTWAWDFLLHYSLFPNYSHHYMNVPEWKEVADECAVCLCKIEEGEEIREVRCGHMYHRECLDRWVGHGRNNNHGTCPSCRVCLDPTRRMENYEVGEEVIILNFSSFSWSSDNRFMWWLR